jgi:HK97 family phage prohead protease
MKEYEKRTNIGNVECRQTDDGETYIEGRGIVFNEISEDLGGFQERIMPEAVADIDWGDVYSFINHNPNIVMGRTRSKTMTIEVRDDGVHYSVKPPKSAGRYIENIQRGDIDGSSFMFRIAENGDVWQKRDGQVPLRTITKFEKIKEMGAVVGPAYPQANADVAVRSMEQWFKEHEPEPVVMDDATRMKGDLLKVREKDNQLN